MTQVAKVSGIEGTRKGVQEAKMGKEGAENVPPRAVNPSICHFRLLPTFQQYPATHLRLFLFSCLIALVKAHGQLRITAATANMSPVPHLSGSGAFFWGEGVVTPSGAEGLLLT